MRRPGGCAYETRGCAGQADALRQHGSAGARRGSGNRRRRRAARRMRRGTRRAEAAYCSKMQRRGSAPRAEKKGWGWLGARRPAATRWPASYSTSRPRKGSRYGPAGAGARGTRLRLRRIARCAEPCARPSRGRACDLPCGMRPRAAHFPHCQQALHDRSSFAGGAAAQVRSGWGPHRGGRAGLGRLALGHVRNALDHQSAREVGVPGQVNPVPQGHLAAGL